MPSSAATTSATRARSTSTSTICATRSRPPAATPAGSSPSAAPATASAGELRVLGLRVKLALAFVATSAITLVVSVGTLVPPLEHRLEQDRVRDLRELARTAGLALTRMPADDLRTGARGSRRMVHRLAARVGGDVALFDEGGRSVAASGPTAPRTVPVAMTV